MEIALSLLGMLFLGLCYVVWQMFQPPKPLPRSARLPLDMWALYNGDRTYEDYTEEAQGLRKIDYMLRGTLPLKYYELPSERLKRALAPTYLYFRGRKIQVSSPTYMVNNWYFWEALRQESAGLLKWTGNAWTLAPYAEAYPPGSPPLVSPPEAAPAPEVK